MDQFKILVSGAGSIGSRHANNLCSLGVKSLSVCDPNEGQMHILSDGLSCTTYTDFDEALNKEQPDIVFVCSPSKFHMEQALKAVKANAHIFIEKPLSNTLENIDELAQEIEKRSLTCMVGCNMRFHPGPATVKRLIQEERIGKVNNAEIYTGSYLPDWRPHQDYKKSYSADPEQGGAILDCIHELDLVLWYFGPAKLKSATTEPATSIGLSVEGSADLILQHASGTESFVHLSFIEPEYKRFCLITGSDGSIQWDIHKKNVEVMNIEGEITDSCPATPKNDDFNQLYIDEIIHFLECVQGNRTPEGNLKEAQQALVIALAARNNS